MIYIYIEIYIEEKKMRDIRKVVHGLKPAMMMLMVQIAFASVNVLYKFAINDGMSVRVLTAYRLIFAAATTIPLALIFERSSILLLHIFKYWIYD